MAVTLVRGDNPCVSDFEFWVAKEHADPSWNSLLQGGVREIHETAFETFRVLCGIPKIGADIRERTLPQETAQDRALHFNKGCYIGQEIVERIRAQGQVNRKLMRVDLEGETIPERGAKTTVGVNEAEIMSAVFSPEANHVIALAYVRVPKT
jgi:folate-binding protein YgfZ